MLWLRYAMHARVDGRLDRASSPDKTFRTAYPRFQVLRGTLLLLTSAMAFNALRTCRWPSSPPSS